MIAGVAGGLADALGVGAPFVRAAFLTLASIWGLGLVLYVALWLYAYEEVGDGEPKHLDSTQKAGLAMCFAGAMWCFEILGWWPHPALVITVATLAFGTAALIDRAGSGTVAVLFDPGAGAAGRVRVAMGVFLVVVGVTVFATTVGPLFEANVVVMISAILITALGVALGFGPMVRRLVADLARERNERIRQEERAEMAAHLHDSVLQTLALIQRTDDLSRISMLARHQEQELRDWLFGTAPAPDADLMSTALRQAARRVEDDYQVPVDVVVVGDRPLDDPGRSLVAAASEAMVNAAKHSGAARISLYFETEDDGVSIYVTDQGKGFDAGTIPLDRRGIADSIVGRVRKVGGTATITSAPGEGTEVHLRLPVEA